MFCCSLLCVRSSIAIILMGKRELVALLNLSSWCLVMVERLFLAVPQDCLRFVIVVFPDHTHLLFFCALVLLADSTDTSDRRDFGALVLLAETTDISDTTDFDALVLLADSMYILDTSDFDALVLLAESTDISDTTDVGALSDFGA